MYIVREAGKQPKFFERFAMADLYVDMRRKCGYRPQFYQHLTSVNSRQKVMTQSLAISRLLRLEYEIHREMHAELERENAQLRAELEQAKSEKGAENA